MKRYDPDRVTKEFYASGYYDPRADLSADNIKYAIEFMLDFMGSDLAMVSRCAKELSDNVGDRDGLSNETEITLDFVHDILKEN